MDNREILFQFPDRCKRFASNPKRADRRCGRRSLLYSWWQRSLLGVERQERVLIIHFSMVLRLKIRWRIPPRLLTFLWYTHEQVYFTSLSFFISKPVSVAEILKYVLLLSAYRLFSNSFFSGTFWNRAETLVGLHVMWSFFCRVLNKWLYTILRKASNVQFHQNLSSSSRIGTGRSTVILINAPQGHERA
jgi:hypothetical protein